MKVSKFVIVGFVLVFFILGWPGISDVRGEELWPRIRGELCWEMEADGGEPTIIRLAIMRTVRNHYIVNGTSTRYDIPEYDEYVQLLSGNAEIVGEQVIMHVTSSGFQPLSVHDQVWGFMGTVKLDLETLDGIGAGIGYGSLFGEAPHFSCEDPGSLTWIPCP